VKGLLGYGRYDDDPDTIGCPRAKTFMTPCVARDGKSATSNKVCVGCGAYPIDLLVELVREASKPPTETGS
jgi:hypothetical protein